MASLLVSRPTDSINVLGRALRRSGFSGGDVYATLTEARQAASYYRGTSSESGPAHRALEKRWYASLAAGQPDFGVYAAPEYVADVWACWAVYSRGYVRALSKLGLLSDFGRIVDLGCGIGFTTVALAEAARPGTHVVGTQLRSSPQWMVASKVFLDGSSPVPALVSKLPDSVPAKTLVFAAEYFEHFEAPVDHLREVLLSVAPHTLVVANSFGTRAIGHFESYVVDQRRSGPRETSSAFSSLLRSAGYRKVETGFWNSRPQVWSRA